MFYNGFVVAVKVNGKYIREEGNIVKIPFGSEYSLYLKNLENRDAVVSIFIDGKDVVDGKKIIVRKNSVSEIDGFIKENKTTNRFKFIQVTPNIENHRGIFPEDSLIRFEVTYEKKVVYVKSQPTWISIPTIFPENYTYPLSSTYQTFSSGEKIVCNYASTNFETGNQGITVRGNKSDQYMEYGYIDGLEDINHVILLKLVGYNGEAFKTSREKIQCDICGRFNRPVHKFCSECGSFLE